MTLFCLMFLSFVKHDSQKEKEKKKKSFVKHDKYLERINFN